MGKRESVKKKPSGKGRDRRKKKALAGPRKPAAKPQAKRRAMIAAARRRIDSALAWVARETSRVDRAVNRRMQKAQPVLARHARRAQGTATRWAKVAGRRLRPAAILLLRGFARAEKELRRAGAAATRAATRGSTVITPRRALCSVVVGAAACLVVSQFVDYRGVEIGQPGYAGLPAVAAPPAVDVRAPGPAHAYVLVPIALLAAALAVLSLRPGRRGLGRIVAGLGGLSVAIVLVVDLPAGLDVGRQAARFSGASAVLKDGFYAELAAAIAVTVGGLLLAYGSESRARKPRPARARRGERPARNPASPREGNRPRAQADEGLRRSVATIPRRA